MSDVKAQPRLPTTLYSGGAAESERELLSDCHGRVYCWLEPGSRNTWPTWHRDRPAPTPGCGCVHCDPTRAPWWIEDSHGPTPTTQAIQRIDRALGLLCG